MNEPIKILSAEQEALVKEFETYYDIARDDVMFFADEPRPFLSYEATCLLCNVLTDLRSIEVELAGNQFPESVVYRCSLELPDGKIRMAVGVVNTGETIQGKELSPQQIAYVATSRAIRNVLRASGIDLYRLHREFVDQRPAESGPLRDLRSKLLAEAHILGKESALIDADNTKTAWRRLLHNRYQVYSAADLSDEQLADFTAVLKTLVPQQKRAA
ncbi:MAG: hypothetical protein IPN69_08080 [Acidobacteria bacterium]|nr:hypothetical protein [Acidobacteriota bacterium]